MPVFRVERNGNYTTMSNYYLQDRELRLKAKGLLSMCLSLTDSWDYSVNGLVAISKKGRTSVLSGLKEQKDFLTAMDYGQAQSRTQRTKQEQETELERK